MQGKIKGAMNPTLTQLKMAKRQYSVLAWSCQSPSGATKSTKFTPDLQTTEITSAGENGNFRG